MRSEAQTAAAAPRGERGPERERAHNATPQPAVIQHTAGRQRPAVLRFMVMTSPESTGHLTKSGGRILPKKARWGTYSGGFAMKKGLRLVFPRDHLVGA